MRHVFGLARPCDVKMPPFALYILVLLVLCGSSLFSRRHDVVACAFIALLLTLSAGLRPYGFDYAEYLLIIDSIFQEQVDDIDSLMTVAKDPFFSSVVLITGMFSDDPHNVLLAIAVLSVGTKYLVAISLPRYSSLFLGAYSILLAPGLEFAAIRSGMSLGFLGLMFIGTVSLGRRVGIAVLATLSHISALVPIGMLWLTKPRRLDVFLILLLGASAGTYFAIAFFDVVYTLDIVTGVNRSSDYLYDKGTTNNFFIPIVTMLVLAMATGWIFARQTARDISKFPPALIMAALLCATAFGAALPISTYVIRILEFAWFLYLYAMVALFAKDRSGFFRSGFVLWLFLLGYVNVYRETWEMMAPALFMDW